MELQMPYCSQCGNQVGAADPFCGRCGSSQPVPASAPGRPPVTGSDPLSGMTPRTASILCYIPWIGWVMAVIVLAADRYRHDRVLRFHAFQALYLFVAALLNNYVLRWLPMGIPHFGLHRIVDLVLLGLSIFMMVKASREEAYSLPLFGELAARSVAEN